METFTLTLTAHEALATKRGYENKGYQVQMSEIGFQNPVTGKAKYYFSLTAKSNRMIEGAYT